MANSFLVVENFFDEADAVRDAFERHFQEPQRHTDRHQVWNYWHVPELYTYMRTRPQNLLPEDLVNRFLENLNVWAMNNYGLRTDENPWLSLYVNGCGQGLHNDSRNGQMGYVYSLTKWDERNFLGGETILFHDENYWETSRIKQSGAGDSFYLKVPSKFNQLLMFDDRVIHGVQPIQGTMVPEQGRVVMHGHLRAGVVVVNGGLMQRRDLQTVLGPAIDRVAGLAREIEPLYHGFATLRLLIDPDGKVTAMKTLVDRILPLSPEKARLDTFKQEVKSTLMSVAFPKTGEPSELTLPVMVG